MLKILCASGGFSLAGCLSGDKAVKGFGSLENRNRLRVGSKPFPEQKILGYMALESLREKTDALVIDEIAYGGSKKCWEGVVSGDLDVYWEYTGTQWSTLPPKHDDWIRSESGLYKRVRKDVRDFGLRYLNRAPFTNSFILLTTPEWSARNGVKSISDLAEHVNSGNTDFRMSIGYDFLQRPDGWPQLVETYGFDEEKLREWQENNTQIVSVGLTYELLLEGDIEVGMGFTTDAQIRRGDFVILEDDKNFFPPYNPAPVVRKEVIDSVSGTKEALKALGPEIDGEDTMRRLNSRVVYHNEYPRKVARDFLRERDLI